MDKEAFKKHLRKTVQEYLSESMYPVPAEAQSTVDAVVGSALLSGIALMSDWQDDLQYVLSPESIRESVEEIGNEYGYNLSDEST